MRATIINHVPFESQNGIPGIKFKCSVLKGDVEATIFVDCWMSEKAVGMTRKALKILGLNLEDPNALREWTEAMTEPYTSLAGRTIEVAESEEEFNGKIQTKYNFVLQEAASPNKVRAMFDALVGAKKTTPTTGPRLTAPRPQTTPAPAVQQQNLI